jgi:hypothetical protein
MFASGLLLGLGFVSRETTVFAMAAVVVMFLFGFGVPRRWYFAVGAGFLTIWGMELLYLWAMTGDPLYRVNIARNHDSNLDRTANLEGNFLVHPWLDPLLTLLVNQEFALLFWVAIPAALVAMFSNVLPAVDRRICRVLGLFALCWFLGAAVLSKSLVLSPRYFFVSALLLTMVSAWLLVALWHRGWRKLTLALAVMLLLGNGAGIAVDNRDFSYGEFTLRELVRADRSEIILSDRQTIRRAQPLLVFDNHGDRAEAGVPTQGRLFFVNRLRLGEYSPAETARCLANQSQWELLASDRPPIRFPFNWLDAAGAGRYVPERLWKRLTTPHAGFALYRVTTDESGTDCRVGAATATAR